MSRTNEKSWIVEHYDRVSPYYYSLWGQHLHHGYWIRGDESKEIAQQQLVELLAHHARVRPGAEVLDIGCGFGASSLYLAEHYGVHPTGITISPVQVEMANRAAAATKARARFLLMDAECMSFETKFDLLWSVESISHYQDVGKFFASAARFLKPGGTFALTDWFKRDNLSGAETRKFIAPIEKGMFVELHTMEDYARHLTDNGLAVVHQEALNAHCARTWELGLDIIKDKAFWALAAQSGSQFVTYLRSFRAMRAGFASGSFVYGLLVAVAPQVS